MTLTSIPCLRRSARMLCFAFALVGLASLAQAEPADRNKPMKIDADAMRYDDLNQTSVFTGNVIANKGTIQLRGERIEVRQDPEGYQYGVITAAPGKLAYFKQKRNSGADEWIEGEGEVIEYDSRADNIKFVRQAVMRRLIGATPNDETSGPLIVYDQSKDTYTVSGSPANAAAAPGRVRAVLTPKPTTATAPASGAKAATVAPSKPVSTGLRATTTLGGDSKK